MYAGPRMCICSLSMEAHTCVSINYICSPIYAHTGNDAFPYRGMEMECTPKLF
jgi:hypothetical protein